MKFLDDRFRNHDPDNCDKQVEIKRENLCQEAQNAPHELFNENNCLKKLLAEELKEGM